MSSSHNPFSSLTFRELGQELRKKFLSLPHEIQSFAKGDIIHHQGDPVTRVGFVDKGILTCSRFTEAGSEIIPHYFYEGETFPEYLLFTNKDGYIYTLIAAKPVEIIFIQRKDLLDRSYHDLTWSRLLISYMAHRGLLESKWALCTSYPSLQSKVAYMLEDIYQVPPGQWVKLEDSQSVIAQKLRVSRPVYNQELSKLEKANILERKQGKIKILDPEALHHLT